MPCNITSHYSPGEIPPRLCRLLITSRQPACSTPSAPPCRVIPSSSLLGEDSLQNKQPADPRLVHAAAATLSSPLEPLNDNILRAKPDYAVQHVGGGSCEPPFPPRALHFARLQMAGLLIIFGSREHLVASQSRGELPKRPRRPSEIISTKFSVWNRIVISHRPPQSRT